MAIKKGKYYLCPICREKFPSPYDADFHRDSVHQVIYVPFTKEMLGRLLQFIYTKDENLLTPEFVQSIQDYNRHAIQTIFEKEK